MEFPVFRLPSDEGSGLKSYGFYRGRRLQSLPSDEGSGLKSMEVQRNIMINKVFPRMREVD